MIFWFSYKTWPHLFCRTTPQCIKIRGWFLMNSFVVSLRSIFTGRLIVKRLINCCLITAFNLVRYKARWRDRGLGAGWAGLKLTINVYLDGVAGGGDLLLLPGHNYQNPGCHFRPIIARGEGEPWKDHPCPPAHSAQQRFVINKAEIALFIHAGGRCACV